MPVTSYRTVARDGSAEIVVSRSRFRCSVARASDEVAARTFVETIRREHWDARHHCVAFVLGPDRTLEQSNDDGEPPGTLLGTGRLARAYGDATRAALDEVGTVERVLQVLCEVTVDIAAVGRLEHDLRSRGAHVLGVDYTAEATLRFAVPPRSRGTAEALVAELTSGGSALRVVGEQWVDADG